MLQINVRHYFSSVHLQAAQLSADRAKNLEATHAGPAPGPLVLEHRGYVVQAIVGTVAYLEAAANEMFADAEEGHGDKLKGIDPATVDLMASMWRQDIPRTARYSVLTKYEVALALARKPGFDRGAAPYQPVKLVVDLRNALVHYEPEWIPADSSPTPGERHKFDKQLRSLFAHNPFAGAGNSFYPDKCLSYGCAQWAIDAGIAFTKEFQRRIGKA